MIENPQFPPYLPEELQNKRDLWIGQLDPYEPQLIVVHGPTSEELHRAHQQGTKVRVTLESRTADMDEDEPNDKLGDIEVTIEKLYEDEEQGFYFLACGEDIPFRADAIWVWCYKSGEGGADILVDD